VSERVARSRELVAAGFAVVAVARVLQISRQAVYRVLTPRRPPQRRPSADPVERAIGRGRRGEPDRRLQGGLRDGAAQAWRRRQPQAGAAGDAGRAAPQLWQLNLTSVWVAEHG
jgi:hypothetical protein